MALDFSTGLRNFCAGTGSLYEALTGLVLSVYSGTDPGSADAALGSATLLCTYSGDGVANAPLLWNPTPVDGAVIKDDGQGWSGTGVGNGNGAFFRLHAPADTGASSTSSIRIHGTVGISGADLNLTNGTSFSVGAPQVLHSAAIAIFGS